MERTQVGPFERLVFTYQTPLMPTAADLAVYRIGDLLIDTGGTRVAAQVARELAGDPPRRIALTHQHEDHAGAALTLRRSIGHVPVWAARPHLPALATAAPVPPYRELYWGHPEPCADAQPLDPGTILEAGGVAIEAVATPGHTPGHLAYVARHGDDVYAITGDLFVLTVHPVTAWYEAAADDIVASCRALARLGDRLRVLPTHGPVRLDGAAVMTELADWVEREADAVRETAARLGARDLRRIARERYGPTDDMDVWTGGEFSRVAFVRSVLEPVRELPASVPA